MWTGSKVPPKMPIRMTDVRRDRTTRDRVSPFFLFRQSRSDFGGGDFGHYGRDEATVAPLQPGGARRSRQYFDVPVIMRQLWRTQRRGVQAPVVRRFLLNEVERRQHSFHQAREFHSR